MADDPDAQARAKGRYTGLKTYLKLTLGDLNSYISSDHCEQIKILGFKATVSGVLEQLTVCHNKIISFINPKEVEAEVIEHMKGIEPSYSILAAADLKIEQLKMQSQIESPIPSSGLVHANVSPVQCKLPKILLPEFSGDPLKWQGFWDQYQVAIDNKNNISDIDKFNYLKGCLKGEALSAVSGLTLNSEN